MPRKRHDTSSEDTDSSDGERMQARHSKSRLSEENRNFRESQGSRTGLDSARSLSPANIVSRERQKFSSDSDSSPVKGSVVSKVERAIVAHPKGERSFTRGQQFEREEKADFRGQNTEQQFGKRDVSPGRFDRRDNRNRDFMNRQRAIDWQPRRHERQNRSVSRDRADKNFGRRRSFSPDRNLRRFNMGRKDGFARERGNLWREQERERYGSENRGHPFRYDPRSRSFDRQNIMKRNRDFEERNRQPVRDRSRSPDENIGGSDFHRNIGEHSLFPELMRSKSRDDKSVSPVPPSKSEKRKEKQKSVPQESEKTNNSSGSPRKSKRSMESDRTAAPPHDTSMSGSNAFNDGLEKISDLSKKSRSKKKKKNKTDKDDSVERSFERSKLLLEETTHSEELIPEIDEIPLTSSPVRMHKKSKRQQELQDDEMLEEYMSKKSKPGKSPSKKNKKTSKKKVLSRSPSQTNSLQERKRSRSPQGSFRESHDLGQFESESEPESGEITDSEEEHARKSMKSLVNKPVIDAEPVMDADNNERYLNQKRKEAKMKERQEENQVLEKTPKRKADEIKEDIANVELAAKKPKPASEGAVAFTGRTGGAYIPPARLRAMQAKITDKSSVEFQRISWEALKKSINGLVNKVNVANIENIVREIFQENIVRGRGLMARSIIQAQAASPTFTHVYAALVAIVNTKFPQNGELILKRLIIQFRRGYKRNDKGICLSSTRFIAHLVNQQVAHEVLALEILTLLLETPTDDSVEVAIGFLKECGQKLTEVSPRGINAIFERLRNVLHEGHIDIRVQYMVEVMFAVRKDHFKDYPAILEDLDLVEEEDQFTHLLTLEDAVNGEEILNVFKPDPDFEANEEKYKILKQEILGEGSSDDEEGGFDSGSGSESDEEDSEDEEAQQKIIDQTETNMVALRRTIYLTIQSSLDFEECAHKLMKMELKPGQEVELCSMILDCCAQMRTYEKFFGLLAGRFCMLDKKYVEPFQRMFKEQYDTIHRLETNKLRNVAKFFAHLLHTDSISWAVLQGIKLNEDDTTSASRIFIKILFQELSEYLGLPKLNERLKDPTLQEYYAGLLPRDNPRDTRFAINFFTTIGLGGLTDDLREHLKDISKKLMQQKQEEQAQAMQISDDSSSSEESDTTEESESSQSTSESESSDDERRKTWGRVKPKDKRKAEKELIQEQENKKVRNKANGKHGRTEDLAGSKKSRKIGKKIEKEPIFSDQEKKKEQEEQFKKLAKLADYGNIDDINQGFEDSKHRSDSKTKNKNAKKKSKEKKEKRDNQDLGSGERRREDEDPEVLDEFDARRYADTSYDSQGGGSGERRGRGNRGPRDERGNFEERDRRNLGGIRRDKDRSKKERNFLQDTLDERDVRVERNFERLDLYEEKFQRQREQNLEVVRGREEFQEYYRDREIDSVPRRSRAFPLRGRGSPNKRGRVDRFEYEPRDPDRGVAEGPRRGRNRSEDGAGRNDRRLRR